MNSKKPLRGLLARAPLAAAVSMALLSAPTAQAFDFERGGVTGSLDTTVSYGISVRAQEQDEELIGKAHFAPDLCRTNVTLSAPSPALFPFGACSSGFPGSAAQLIAPGRFSVNRDDGNVKYDEGDAFSNAIKVTSELSLKWEDWGLFTRASYFYDFENAGRDDLTQAAREKVGEDLRLLDAFVYRDFQWGDHSGTVRLGRQVVSWGESTFIQNGINVANPVDVSKLRVAGSELKEAFQPIDMIWGSFNLTENLSVEGMYMFEFDEIEPDPSGTYFSSNDFATPGGSYVMLGFGTVPQPVANPELYNETCLGIGNGSNALASDLFDDYTDYFNANPINLPSPPFPPGTPISSATLAGGMVTIGCSGSVPRLRTHSPSDSGQWGFAVHWLAEEWGNTEFGFYFLNYHSRLPLLSGVTVSTDTFLANPPASPGRSAGYFVEYPENIQMYGMSWNTTLPGGIAFQGEVSYRPNMPLQVDDVELLFAALSPLNTVISAQGGPPAAWFCSQLNPGCAPGTFNPVSEMDRAPWEQAGYVRGWRRHEVSQLQMTFTKAFPSVLGSEQVALVGEIGATEVWDLPSQDVLRYEGEGTDTGGGLDVSDPLATCFFNPNPPTPGIVCPGLLSMPGSLRNPVTQVGGFPTQFSWGYRVAARADYNNVFGSPITLSPRIAFNHDVNGITPGPGGNFLEGRKSATAGLEANYLNKWVFDLSYTAFWGGGRGGSTDVVLPIGVECPDSGSTAGGVCSVKGTPFNQIHDRDFYSFTVKYSF
jgi:hypothetical protein